MQRYVVGVLRAPAPACAPAAADGDARQPGEPPTPQGDVLAALLLRRHAPPSFETAAAAHDAWDVVAMQDVEGGVRAHEARLRSNPQEVLLDALQDATALLWRADGRKVSTLKLLPTSDGGTPCVAYLVTISEEEATMVQRALSLLGRKARHAHPWSAAQLFWVRDDAAPPASTPKFVLRGARFSPSARHVLLHLGVKAERLR